MGKRSWTPVLVLVGLALTGCNRKIALEPVLLGHLAPLSGPEKTAGEHACQGILLAIEEVNKDENQISGRHLAVLHVDTHGDAATAHHEAVRLLTVNRVQGLLGGTDAAEVEQLGRDAHPYGIPLVTPAALPVQGTTENLFSVNMAPAYRGQILARFAAQRWKEERVALLSDTCSPTLAAVATAFSTEWVKLSGSRPGEWPFQGDTDWAELAGRLQKVQPGVILFAGSAGDLLKLRRQFQEKSLQVPLLFGAEDLGLATGARSGANEGVYGATVYVAASDSAQGQEFARKYEERFHQPPDVHAALAHDSIRLLFEAMRRARSFAGVKVREELARVDQFDSVSGPLTMGRDHCAQRVVFVVRWENGQAQVVQRYDAPGK